MPKADNSEINNRSVLLGELARFAEVRSHVFDRVPTALKDKLDPHHLKGYKILITCSSLKSQLP